MNRVFFFLILGLSTFEGAADDWPTWRYDVERTAESPEQLPEKLELLWHRGLPKPQPAFADVRLQFDGGYEPIVAGQRLFLASNCEDKVTAFDTASGELLWECFVDGPVRLAPVAWRTRHLRRAQVRWMVWRRGGRESIGLS